MRSITQRLMIYLYHQHVRAQSNIVVSNFYVRAHAIIIIIDNLYVRANAIIIIKQLLYARAC